MRAVVMRQGELLVEDAPMPIPLRGEVLVRTLACGVCGTDLHALHDARGLVDSARRSGGGFAGGMDPEQDVILGHEFCAEVVEFGPGTERRLRIGTVVCARPVVQRGGRREVVGFSNVVPGGLAEFMVLSEAQLLEVPAALSPVHAAFTEPFAVGIHAVELASLVADDQPLVVGCGPVGLAVIAALAASGRRPIVAADFSETRREMAVALGADVVVDPASTSPYEAWRDVAVGRPGADGLFPNLGLRRAVIFECVGAPGMIQAVMEGAPTGARIVVLGVCTGIEEFEPMLGLNKELSLQFSVAYTDAQFAAALHGIASGDLPAGRLVNSTIALEDVPAAVRAFESREGSKNKIVVEAIRWT